MAQRHAGNKEGPYFSEDAKFQLVKSFDHQFKFAKRALQPSSDSHLVIFWQVGF